MDMARKRAKIRRKRLKKKEEMEGKQNSTIIKYYEPLQKKPLLLQRHRPACPSAQDYQGLCY